MKKVLAEFYQRYEVRAIASGGGRSPISLEECAPRKEMLRDGRATRILLLYRSLVAPSQPDDWQDLNQLHSGLHKVPM